jgi:AraC family transcriptional regulator of arabinose operon
MRILCLRPRGSQGAGLLESDTILLMKPGLASFHSELRAGRTVIRREHDYGPIYRERGMDGWILNYTAAGRGRINRGERLFHVEPGELLLFKPEVAHDYHTDAGGRWTHLWIYFFPRAHWFDWLAWPEASPGVLRLDLRGSEHHQRIVALFEEAIRLAQSPLARRVQLAMSALEQLLLWCDAANPESRHAHLDPRIQRAVDHLCARIVEPARLGALARLCGVSSSRLSHLFRAQVGVAPMQWLEQQRISRARELLLMTGRPIAEIAAAVGMPNPIWFARVFRRHVGCAPREYRKRGEGKR